MRKLIGQTEIVKYRLVVTYIFLWRVNLLYEKSRFIINGSAV